MCIQESGGDVGRRFFFPLSLLELSTKAPCALRYYAILRSPTCFVLYCHLLFTFCLDYYPTTCLVTCYVRVHVNVAYYRISCLVTCYVKCIGHLAYNLSRVLTCVLAAYSATCLDHVLCTCIVYLSNYLKTRVLTTCSATCSVVPVPVL